jgi:hypothetical protein
VTNLCSCIRPAQVQDPAIGFVGSITGLNTSPLESSLSAGAIPVRQSFLRVHWVAMPKALRARRVNRCCCRWPSPRRARC